MRASRTILLSILILLITCLPVYGAELIVHVNPGGNDLLSGTSESEAVATLQRALKLAEATSAPDLSLVRIDFSPGIYKAQSAIARGNPSGVPIVIASTAGGRAVFNGDGQGGTWLTLKPNGGTPSNLKIVGLEITNYETAIDVVGNRNNAKMWAGGMEIRENYFHKIGDIARDGAKPSTAAIRLVNSDRNIIAKNIFANIKNNKRCGLLHALYIAHGSTDNVIDENEFKDSCGDAVRFRDRSNDNVVRKNQFSNAWSRSPVSDWFCNSKQRSNCTKAEGECPSYNILIEDNKIIAKGIPTPDMFIPYGGIAPLACDIPRNAQRAIVK